jgi:hypothetical protein
MNPILPIRPGSTGQWAYRLRAIRSAIAATMRIAMTEMTHSGLPIGPAYPLMEVDERRLDQRAASADDQPQSRAGARRLAPVDVGSSPLRGMREEPLD